MSDRTVNLLRSARIPLFVLITCLCPVLANADVRLPGFFGDHMVIQQDKEIKVWGWGDAREEVTVTIDDASATGRVNDEGRWMVELPAMKASREPKQLVVKAGNTLTLKDVLIGEVWLCSGQSNMEWTVARSNRPAEEIAAADFPLIRHIKVARRPSMTPLDDIEAPWQVCSPDTVAEFTAVGYFMARRLHQDLNVPIGLINSSWGGTRVEPWTPPVGFADVEALSDISRSVIGRMPGSDVYRKRLEAHLAQTEDWIAKAKSSLSTKTPIEPSPVFPPELLPFKSHQDPTMLYNGMIHALVGYPIRGAIWYQGESNHVEGMLYFEKKKALIQGWRELWGQGDFPFYFVQIAPFQYGNEDPTILPTFWEAQAAVQTLPKTGMVVINDIATLNDIHPPNKQDVGDRLAAWALRNDYGKSDVVARHPELESVVASGETLTLKFSNTAGDLKTRDGQPPSLFEVIGPGSRRYHPAEAVIDGDTVLLTSDEVMQPTAVRFAWNKLAEPNLTGGTGLPVGAFRGGEEPDLLSLLSIESEYQLVYDLDLSELGKQIEYDVDRSDEVKTFARVGYLLELDSKTVFVSMNAFTDDVKKIGIPTLASKARFQQSVSSMNVYTNVTDIPLISDGSSGNIEFWPNNYGPQNGARVPGASNSVYDIGDSPGPPADGYGSMQIHHPETRTTIFAINHWGVGADADLGIGNGSGQHLDWTFSGSAKTYTQKRLRVFVNKD